MTVKKYDPQDIQVTVSGMLGTGYSYNPSPQYNYPVTSPDLRTIEEFAAEARKLTFHGGLKLWSPELRVEVMYPPALIVTIVVRVPERDDRTGTGPYINVILRTMYTLQELTGLAVPFSERIRSQVKKLVMHELDESLQWDGQRMREDH